jgi:hypothetical protein
MTLPTVAQKHYRNIARTLQCRNIRFFPQSKEKKKSRLDINEPVESRKKVRKRPKYHASCPEHPETK